MTERIKIRELSVRYGAAMLIVFFDLLIMPYFFSYLIIPFIPAGEMNGGFLYYTAIMVINDLTAYLVPLIACRLLFRREMPEIGETAVYEKDIFAIILLFAGGVALAAWVTLAAQKAESLLNEYFGLPLPERAFSDSMPADGAEFFVFLIGSVITAPICEELLFRHFLLKPLRRYGDLTAAIVSALCFALYHTNLDQFFYTALLGLALAFVAIRTGSITPCIILHALNNFCVTIASYMPEEIGGEVLALPLELLRFCCWAFLLLLNYGGLLAFVLIITKKLYRLKAPEREGVLPVRAQLGAFFGTPAVLAGIGSLVLMAVVHLVS